MKRVSIEHSGDVKERAANSHGGEARKVPELCGCLPATRREWPHVSKVVDEPALGATLWELGMAM